MALGNSNSSSKSRGKNKPVAVRRIKEVRNAAGFTEFTCGPVAANSTNSCGGGNTGNTFYHDGIGTIPVLQDKIYKQRRARNPNTFTAGFYKVAASGKGSVTLQINSSGVCIGRTTC